MSEVRPPAFPDHPRLKLSEAGLRGVVGETLTVDLAAAFAAAFAEGLPEGPVVLGRDSRLSSPCLADAVAAGLRGVGRDVLDLGLAPTPTVEIYVREKNAAGGIVVTASHNPAEWNALKFVGPGGFFTDREEALAIRRRYEKGPKWRRYDALGEREVRDDAIATHLARVLAVVDAEAIRSKRFRVVVDAVNGTGAVLAPPLLAALGCDGEVLFDDPTKPFPHNPEPKPEHLAVLAERVAETRAHAGFALDPDGDRLALVAEGGRPLSEELTAILAAKHVLAREGGDAVVGNLSGSRALERVAADFGAKVHRTPIGEIHVSKKMRELGAAIGGEGNGGVMYAPVHACRDGATGIALVLEMMAKTGKSLGELAAEIPALAMRKAAVPRDPKADLEALWQKIDAAFAEAPNRSVDRRDGILIEWGPDPARRSWVHVRASNTEPILRIMAEAEDEAEVEEAMRRAQEAIR